METLVLGSKGQIGAALVDHLVEQNHEVVGLDAEFDLRDPANVYRLALHMDAADFIFFLAFDVGGSTYLAEHQASIEFLQNNVQIMENFASAYEMSDGSTPFIFASSQMSNMSWSQYGVLKRLGEFYTTALGGINIRFWNVYGHETDPEKFHVVTDFIHAAMNGNDIVMRTDGSEKRQMLHADDASRALESLMLNYDELNKSSYYDITSFEWVEITQIAQLVASRFDVEYFPGESSDDVQRDAGNEPTSAILEFWTPSIGLEQGIAIVAEQMGAS